MWTNRKTMYASQTKRLHQERITKHLSSQFKHQSKTRKHLFQSFQRFPGETGKKGLSGLARHLNFMNFNAICTKPSTALHDLIHIHTYRPTHTAMPTYYLVQEVNNRNRSNIRLQSNITQLLLKPRAFFLGPGHIRKKKQVIFD